MKKRLISIVAALSMIISLFPMQAITANAALAEKGKIEMVYLTKSTNASTGARLARLRELEAGESLKDAIIQEDGTVGRTSDTLEVGDSFWVGIKVKDLDKLQNFDDASKKYAALIHTSFGVVYDSQYFYDVYTDIYTQTSENEDGEEVTEAVEMPLTENYSWVPGIISNESATQVNRFLPNVGGTTNRRSLNPGSSSNSYAINDGSNPNQSVDAKYKLNGPDDTTSKMVQINYQQITTTANNMFTYNEGVIAVLRFKVKAVPEDGATVFGFNNSNTILTLDATTDGTSPFADISMQGNETDTDKRDYKYYMEMPTALNPFPSGTKKPYQISTKDTNTITNATQYVGSAFSNAGISLQLDKRLDASDTEIEHEDIALTDSKLVFKYTAKDATVNNIVSANALTTVPATWAAADAGDKDIYAVYDGKYFVKVGTVTVAEASINAITNVSGAGITGAVEGGTIQFPTGATIVVKKTNSTTATHNIPKGQWASNSLGMYKVTGTSSAKTYTLVDESTVQFSAGANTFVAAVKNADGTPNTSIMGGEFTINAKTKATLNLAAAATNKTFGDTSTAVTATATATTAATALPTNAYQVQYKSKKAGSTWSTTVPTDAGEYDVKIELTTTGAQSYVVDTTTSTVTTGTLTIAQKEETISITAPTGATYGDAENARKATVTTGLAASNYVIEYKKQSDADTAYSATVPSNAGDYTARVRITNANYKAPTGATLTANYTIAQKEITISEVTVDKVQAGTTGAGLTKEGTHTVTAAEGKVGNDNLIFNFTATYAETDVATATDAVVNATVAAKTPALTIGGQAAANYKLGTGTITGKGGVSSKPSIISVSPIPITATVAANDSANTSVAALAAKLPTTVTATYNDGTGNKTVTLNVAWESEDTFVATGATYTYKAKLSGSDVVDLSYNLTATVEVTEVAAEYPANSFPAKSVAVGADNSSHAALGLTSSVTINVGGTDYNCPVTWTEAANTLDTNTENANATFHGTVDLSSLPAWAKKPSADVTQTVTVGSLPEATDLTDASKQAIADLVKEYSAADGKTLADFEAALAGLTLKVTDGTTEYDATATWTWTKDDPADEFNPQGGTYKYTATLASTEAKVDGITAPTVTFEVSSVTAEYPENAFAAKTVKKNGDNSSHAALGLTTSVTITVNGTDYECPVTWTEAANTLDVTKAGNSVTFNGTVDLSSLPAWVTPPAANVTQTVTVKDTEGSSPSRAGGGSSYVVTFDAGKDGKITKGNKTARVSKGASMRETALPTITANEGYKFVGWSLDGETVDPTTLEIKKAITLKAVYEEDIEETPAPTDAPVINPEYTKPYAGGYDEGDFRPDNNITRAELAAMIARLSYEDELPDGVYSASFWDVDPNAWYNKYIGYLEGLRVFDGYEDGSFQPEKNVTRSELCAVLVRAQKFIITPQDGMFWDVTENEWARDYIATLAQRGIVSGYSDGSFGPYQPLTRAETVTMINKVLDPSTPIVTFTPWDISNHWAENEILLAVNEREVIGSEPKATPVPEETEAPEATVEPEAEATNAPEATVEPEATEVPEA